ncbi:MAG: TolC family protein [Candidatus Omnitrophota bacterium]|nr:TolC family protein [Candidatus Omnitrophota bacterium]MDZ4242981.1 TolC family protein [Candidatus Omnitrophota bacterium]
MKRIIRIGLLTVVLAAGLVRPASAQDAVTTGQRGDVLVGFLQTARDNNPEIKAAYNDWKAAEFRVPQSSALPDPTAGTAVMGRMLETRLGPQEEVYEFEQMIPFPGKLIQKRKMARAEVMAAEARYKMAEREVAAKVTQAYADLAALDYTLQVTEEVYELLRKFESAAQARYASQQGEQRDVAKAQVEVSEALKQLLTIRQQREILVSLLNALLNRDPKTLVEHLALPVRPQLAHSLDDLIVLSKSNRPEILEAEAMKDREIHAKALAGMENAPDFTVGFQYSRIGEGMTSDPEDGRDAWMIPLKVTIPLWRNRINAATREARENLRANEARLALNGNLADYEIKNAYYQLTASLQVVDLYETALLPQAELAFRSDQAGYESGRTDVLNLIDSERSYLNARMAYAQALADSVKNLAAIERAVGVDLSTQGGKSDVEK